MDEEIIPTGEVRGYHIFLMPPPAAADLIRECIQMLSEKYGGPAFEPHITLLTRTSLSEVELLQLTESVAIRPAPEIIFDEIRTGDMFFKCCYISIRTTDELQAMAQELRTAAHSDALFDPHISLAYGEFSPETLSHMKADAEAFLATHPMQNALASSVGLWKTEGVTKNWKLVQASLFI